MGADDPSEMSRRPLLICFDAFGTLFKPKAPIEQQYAEVAASFGLPRFSEDELQTSFVKAFKNEAKLNPNYGKANGMNPERWWTNIIGNTFKPLLRPNEEMPKDLVSKLLWRFWSDEGYVLLPDVQLVLTRLRENYRFDHQNPNAIVGVITNSDPRVPDVLSSLGLRVSPLRYGSEPSQLSVSGEAYDVDFSVMSYDVGHEKPDQRIFAAAEKMWEQVRQSKGGPPQDGDLSSWQKIYVGDEYDKDVVGAVDAGWNAVLIGDKIEKPDVEWRDDATAGKLQDLFNSSKAVGFNTLGKLAEWIR